MQTNTKLSPAQPINEDKDVVWYDAASLPLEGRAFDDTASPYHRLPRDAEAVVTPEVWSLSQNSAGLAVWFATDAEVISARWKVSGDALAMPHMPATGVSGLDLYTKLEGRWSRVGYGRPVDWENQAVLAQDLLAGEREYLLYLPLYNTTESLHIGVPIGSTFRSCASSSLPMVVYGTSIVQGACASRPGMAYPAIMARDLDVRHINLGFSGNGKMHLEMADYLAAIEASVYVLDTMPNMPSEMIAERVAPFVEALRAKRPTTPMLLVECVTHQCVAARSKSAWGHQPKNAELRKQFEVLRDRGINDLHLLAGDELFGGDGEATVDMVHPNDLGMLRMARAIGGAVREILGGADEA